MKPLNTIDPVECAICSSNHVHCFGHKEFNFSCNDFWTGTATYPSTGFLVSYHQCPNCQFIFTAAMDTWEPADFKAEIYNDAYILADPDFSGKRATDNAMLLDRLLVRDAKFTSILDFGGGVGGLAHELSHRGYRAKSYDLFYDTLPLDTSEKYDLITSFEVIEHIPHQQQVPWFQQAASYLRRSTQARMLVSTELSLPDATIDWHYIAPRNGHISLHSPCSLSLVAGRAGLCVTSISSSFHLLTWASCRK